MGKAGVTVSFDDIVGIALLLYFLSSLFRSMLRRGDRPGSPKADDGVPGKASPDGGRRRRTWEEELRELFEEAQGRMDMPPWAEPGPLLEEEPATHDENGVSGDGVPAPAQTQTETAEDSPFAPVPGLDREAERGHSFGAPVAAPAEERTPAAAWAEEERAIEGEDVAVPSLVARPRRFFHPAALREAIVMMEVLGPPRALRPYRPPHHR